MNKALHFFLTAPVQTRPGAFPASYTMGNGSLSREVKRPRRGVNQPPPPSAEVKERVQLYHYCPSGPSWPVLGRSLPVPFSKRAKRNGCSLQHWQKRKTCPVLRYNLFCTASQHHIRSFTSTHKSPTDVSRTQHGRTAMLLCGKVFTAYNATNSWSKLFFLDYPQDDCKQAP
jgi:hypothetical protein